MVKYLTAFFLASSPTLFTTFFFLAARAENLPRHSVTHLPVSLASLGDELRYQMNQGQQNLALVLMGETHGVRQVSDQQVEMIEALRNMGFRVYTALEFLEYPHQSFVDQFRAGMISQDEFLRAIQWSGFDFSLYLRQILFPSPQESSFAINAPRALTRKIARSGMISLTPDERNLLPPNLERGNENYFKRFQEAMRDHLPGPEALENYFMAQSVWDDTMAWQILKRVGELSEKAQSESKLQNSSPSVIVLTVGEFHTAFGGGLPDRLRKRGFRQPMITLSQLPSLDFHPNLIDHPEFGLRSDYYWLH
jgi:uncharacterized iron-regulated protein